MHEDYEPAEALYAAEWEVRKAIGVCADHGDTDGQRAAVKARNLLLDARRAAIVAGRQSDGGSPNG